MKKEDFQEFFKQRMAEIMHKDTLDSYRVRANNAHTILRELSYVLEGWLAGNVKRFETVGLCIDEAINLIENLLAELKKRLKISIFLWRKSCASR